MYGKKTEKAKLNNSGGKEISRRGRQKGTPGHALQEHADLPVKDEICDIPENQLFCNNCHKPYYELKDTTDSELIEIEVSGNKLRIKQKKSPRP